MTKRRHPFISNSLYIKFIVNPLYTLVIFMCLIPISVISFGRCKLWLRLPPYNLNGHLFIFLRNLLFSSFKIVLQSQYSVVLGYIRPFQVIMKTTVENLVSACDQLYTSLQLCIARV